MMRSKNPMHMPDTIPIARKVRILLIPPAPVPKNSIGTRTKKVQPRMKDIRNPVARPDRTAARLSRPKRLPDSDSGSSFGTAGPNSDPQTGQKPNSPETSDPHDWQYMGRRCA
jgi:hypothetical protein